MFDFIICTYGFINYYSSFMKLVVNYVQYFKSLTKPVKLAQPGVEVNDST